jgi:phage-related protein
VDSVRFRWRDYRTSTGGRPVKVFIESLTDEEAASVVAALREISMVGVSAARHLRDDIYEIRAESQRRSFRLLFARATKFILLSLHGFTKKTQKTPARELDLAERRLRDWRARG